MAEGLGAGAGAAALAGCAFLLLSLEDSQLLRLLTAEPRLDYATIADMIQRPVGSIGPTRARCLSQLRQLLKRSPDAEARSDD